MEWWRREDGVGTVGGVALDRGSNGYSGTVMYCSVATCNGVML